MKFNNSVEATAETLSILPNNLSRRMKDLGINSDSLYSKMIF